MDNPDVLSDVFATLRISGKLYFRAELNGRFSIELPEEQRRIRFHLVRHGRCWITVPGSPVSELTEGDLAIVPNGSGQILSAEQQSAPEQLTDIMTKNGLTDGVLTHGTGELQTGLLCGFCRFDEAIDHPVLANMPGLVVIRLKDLGAEPWAISTLRLLAMEADLGTQGTTGILTRLLEIVLIQAMRRMSIPEQETSNEFVAALSDLRLAKALQAIHGRPEMRWTVQNLAEKAGMSRARFADRFTVKVGVPPIEYLTTWRLMKARYLLRTSNLDMNEIASRCGYASAPSFSRRFKQSFGTGPGSYRRSTGLD
jgi:AraC-like DNA-binding protein